VAAKADEFIRGLQSELENVRAAADAASITAEQTCSLLEQKFLALSTEFSKLESQNAQLQSSLDDRLSELAQAQAQKHQLHLQSVSIPIFSFSFFAMPICLFFNLLGLLIVYLFVDWKGWGDRKVDDGGFGIAQVEEAVD
jgi:hypothetical protein